MSNAIKKMQKANDCLKEFYYVQDMKVNTLINNLLKSIFELNNCYSRVANSIDIEVIVQKISDTIRTWAQILIESPDVNTFKKILEVLNDVNAKREEEALRKHALESESLHTLTSFIVTWIIFLLLSQWICYFVIELKYFAGISSHPSTSAQWNEVFSQWNIFSSLITFLISIILLGIYISRKNQNKKERTSVDKKETCFPLIGAYFLLALKKSRLIKSKEEVVSIKSFNSRLISNIIRIFVNLLAAFWAIPVQPFFLDLIKKYGPVNGIIIWSVILFVILVVVSFFEAKTKIKSWRNIND